MHQFIFRFCTNFTLFFNIVLYFVNFSERHIISTGAIITLIKHFCQYDSILFIVFV